MGVVDLFGAIGSAGVVGGVVALFFVRNLNRKLKAETGKLSVDGVAVLTTSATGWVATLNKELEKAQSKCETLTTTVEEMEREVASLHLLVDDLNGKLAEANTRAFYFEDQWHLAAGRPLPKRNPPTATQGN